MSSFHLVGIDPGVTTGIAMRDATEDGFRVVESMYPYLAFDRVRAAWRSHLEACGSIHAAEFLVMVEDARLQRVGGGRTFGDVARLQGVGGVKALCTAWEQLLTDEQIPHIFRRVRTGTTKWPRHYFERTTGWIGMTNEHARDAAGVIFGINENVARAYLAEYHQRRAQKGRSHAPAVSAPTPVPRRAASGRGRRR